MIKPDVVFGQKDLFNDDHASILVQDMLRERINASEKSQDFQLSDIAKEVIKDIHQIFKSIDANDLTLPANEDLLDDFGLTKEGIKSMDLETFTESCNTLAIADVRLFFKLIES